MRRGSRVFEKGLRGRAGIRVAVRVASDQVRVARDLFVQVGSHGLKRKLKRKTGKSRAHAFKKRHELLAAWNRKGSEKDVDAAAWIRKLFVKGAPPVKGAIGLAAIEGLDARTHDITVPQKTLESGTLIVGTTQAGKGVLLTNLVTQAIVRGETVIILDPKMSSRLMNATVEACRIAGRSAPAFFHPSGASRIRLNPLANFERTSELASRITAVMNKDGPFTAFAWSAVNTVCALLIDCGKSPTIALIESALSGGLPALIREALERH